MIQANEANQKLFIDRYLEEGIKIDYWWMDAGWYVNKTGWPNTGTWEVDTNRFPRGLRAITDHAHAKGVKSIVWFEPERVTPGTWLHEKHPEWLLKGTLLNLGQPEARQWLTDHIDKLLSDQGIDLYRQDYNIDPLSFWRGNDAADVARASPRTITSPATWPTGMICAAAIRPCSSIPAPRAATATIWKRCGGPCPSCAAITFKTRSAISVTPTASPSGFRITEQGPTRPALTKSAAGWLARISSPAGTCATGNSTTTCYAV